MGEDKSLYILANILGQRGDHRGSQLAALVANCRDPAALRRFACACAEHALVATGLRDPVLSDALVFACSLVGAHLSARIAKVRGSVARIVESLDQKAFDAQDAEEVGKASRRAYLEAFHRLSRQWRIGVPGSFAGLCCGALLL